MKTRLVGHSKTLTIPKEYSVPVGTEFDVSQNADGSLLFKPADRNPFEGDWYHKDLRQTDITLGSEVLDSEWAQ
ncbi:MAG TPA: AbrB family transcriptional regulator [Lactobacillus sp.]|nr:AbrB family transcriptional regulator [Lactobacillus sp.]